MRSMLTFFDGFPSLLFFARQNSRDNFVATTLLYDNFVVIVKAAVLQICVIFGADFCVCF